MFPHCQLRSSRSWRRWGRRGYGCHDGRVRFAWRGIFANEAGSAAALHAHATATPDPDQDEATTGAY